MNSTIETIEEKLNKEIDSFFRTSKINVSGKQVTYEKFLEDKMLIVVAIRKGIPYSLFYLIQKYTPFSENDWANFHDLSTKSLQRYVTKVGLDVFGNVENLKLWLNTPSFALGKLKPIELLKDSYGKEMVISELHRMNYGIFV